MAFPQLIFFIFLLLFTLYPKVSCQSLTCGNNTFFIQYPFKLLQESRNPKTKSHSNFNLECNNQGLTVLNIPLSGDFYVRDIDYFDPKIQLYDPGKCLPGRLMNLSLSTSPFTTTYSDHNYTFFRCPSESLNSRNLTIIDCLSNSTTSVLATSVQSMRNEIARLRGCHVIVNVKIPVSSLDQDENNVFDGDLQLAWIDQSCNEDCKAGKQRLSVLGIILICFITIAIAMLGTLFCIGCCIRFRSLALQNNEANSNTQRVHSSYSVWEVTRITLPLAEPLPLPHSSPPRPNLSTGDNNPWTTFSSEEQTVTTTPNREVHSPPRPNFSTEGENAWANFLPEEQSVTTTPDREEIHLPPRPNFLNEGDNHAWARFSPEEQSVTTTPNREEVYPMPPRPDFLTEGENTWEDFFSGEESVTTTPNQEEYSSTEVLIIGGKECISGPNSDSCTICLQEYSASERLRRICKCDHCFHAHCLELWLQTKNTCPHCRTEVK